MATSFLFGPGALFRSWRTKKDRRPARSARRILFQESLEQRTVLSAVSPVEGLLEADYDGNGVVDLNDLNTINRWIGPSGDENPYYSPMDLDEDGMLTRGDVDELVRFLRTTYGDADFDGKFDTSDMNKLFVHNQFEDGRHQNSTWETGDFDGNGEFDTSDLIYVFQNGLYELDGDVNGDGNVDHLDIDTVNCWAGASGNSCGPPLSSIDINRDGTIDRDDVDTMVRLVGTTYGDADLDGVFTSQDLTVILERGKLDGGRASWIDGDFNGDTRATLDDLDFAFERSIYGLDEMAIDVVFAG